MDNPGRFAGLNVGVLLLKLSKMRQNQAYNHYMTSKGIQTLVNTYGLNSTTLGKISVRPINRFTDKSADIFSRFFHNFERMNN